MWTEPTSIGCHGNVLGDQNTHVRLIIYIHSSTNPENLAKIGPVDVEIIGLTEIIKV